MKKMGNESGQKHNLLLVRTEPQPLYYVKVAYVMWLLVSYI